MNERDTRRFMYLCRRAENVTLAADGLAKIIGEDAVEKLREEARDHIAEAYALMRTHRYYEAYWYYGYHRGGPR